ncbi:MAG: hypothetical protein ACI8TQ_002690, partial [Planctomycetota bacterium]
MDVTGFCFNSTGTRVAGIGWSANRVVVWDSSQSDPLWTGEIADPSHAVFSPDGKLLAAGSMQNNDELSGVVVFNAENGAQIAGLDGGDIRNLAFSPDGRWLAFGENSEVNGRIFVYDTSTWTQVGEFDGHDWIITEVRFSPDSNQIISTDMSGQILVRERESGTITHDLAAHGFKINGLVLSPDGKTWASCSKDGQTILWDAATYQKIATIILGRDEDAVIATPDGYYTMSPGARELVAFADGLITYPFEQFDLRLNRPDIVVQRLGRSSLAVEQLYERAWAKRVKRMGFTTDALNQEGEIPTLAILKQDELPLSQSTRNVTIRVRAEGSSPLERLNLFVNDVPVWGSSGRNLSEVPSLTYEGDIEIELGSGRNKIQVSCHNSAGFESLRST